ncbi:MAG: amino acid permease, partial [Flavobacteriales bacterium]|nr:amino acid permease [Flavobacteriales bacterium]
KYVLPFLVVGSIIFAFTNYKNDTMNFLTNKAQLKETKDLIIDLSEKESKELKANIAAIDHEGLNRVGSDLLAYFEQAPKVDLETSLRGIDSRIKAENVSELDEKTKKRLVHFLEGYDEKGFSLMNKDLGMYYAQGPKLSIKKAIAALGIKENRLYNSGFGLFAHKVPTWIFLIFTLFITVVTVRENYSLIPLLGLLSCLYMMSQVELKNWVAFVIWLVIGLVIYFSYGRKHSKLNSMKS